MNLALILTRAARRWPGKTALVFEGRRWTYERWNAEVNQAAHAFRARGIGQGDRVATLTYNLPEQVTTFYGLLKLGAVPVPVNYRLAANEVRYIVEDSGARLVLVDPALADRARGLAAATLGTGQDFDEFIAGHPTVEPLEARVGHDDPAFIMYTSGTTGRPKGVVRTHRQELFGGIGMLVEGGFQHTDVMLDNSPLFHIAQLQIQFNPIVQLGATNVLTRGFDAHETLSLIGRERVTILHGVPTQFVMIADADLGRYDLSSLRVGFYGGSTMADDVTRRCADLFPAYFADIYGSTEALVVTACDYKVHPDKMGSAGKAVVNMDTRVVDIERGRDDPNAVVPAGQIGQLICRGATVFREYFNLPDRTAEVLRGGWYYTGDAAYEDGDGFLYVLGRLDHTIKSGGENVHPSEIENVLFEHPGILSAAVVGLPSRRWGQVIAAAVIRKDPSLTVEAIDRFCRESPNLADFKRPRVIVFVDEIPANPTGKVERGVLREQLLKIVPNVEQGGVP
jgi:long-chain acyl-CoA synthetase